jgi:hypothetical protein
VWGENEEGCGAWGVEFRVEGSGCWFQGSGFRVQEGGVSVQGLEFGIWGVGCRAKKS